MSDNKKFISDPEAENLSSKLRDKEGGLVQAGEVVSAVLTKRPVLTISLAPADGGPPMLLMNQAISKSTLRNMLIEMAIKRLEEELVSN